MPNIHSATCSWSSSNRQTRFWTEHVACHHQPLHCIWRLLLWQMSTCTFMPEWPRQTGHCWHIWISAPLRSRPNGTIHTNVIIIIVVVVVAVVVVVVVKVIPTMLYQCNWVIWFMGCIFLCFFLSVQFVWLYETVIGMLASHNTSIYLLSTTSVILYAARDECLYKLS